MKIWPAQRRNSQSPRPTTLTDSITYLASLASNPSAIQPFLGDVHLAPHSPQASQPTPVIDEQKLLDAYFQLEDYLTTEEPLRNFTREQLRQRLGPEVQAQLNGANVPLAGPKT